MSRDISHFIANLNSLDPIDSPSFSGDHSTSGSPNHGQGSSSSNNGQNIKNEQDDELSIFANTQFFDFDMGRSTDIAVTVDDLLMQQEKLLQNPKGKPHPDEQGNGSGSGSGNGNGHGNGNNFYSNLHNHSHGLHHINQYPSHQLPGSSSINGSGAGPGTGAGAGTNAGAHGPLSRTGSLPSHISGPASTDNATTANNNHLNGLVAPFDFASLQQFSIANELAPHSIHQSPVLSGVSTPLPLHSPHIGPISNNNIHGSPIVSLDSSSSKLSNFTPSNTIIKPSSTTNTPSASKRKTSNASTRLVNRSSTTSTDSSNDSITSPSNSLYDGDPKVAEEDKRRRNTAASARFRIKKKIREQEMERNARELLDKVQQLETKVMQLEMENRWLKNLVVEKNEARDVTELLNMRNRILGKAEDPSDTNHHTDIHP